MWKRMSGKRGKGRQQIMVFGQWLKLTDESRIKPIDQEEGDQEEGEEEEGEEEE